MAKTIITIGREYCTGGNYIAEDVANALGIKLYDKELITMAAKHSGLSEEAVAASEKRHTHSLLYSLYTMGNELPLGDQVFILQSRIIKQLAVGGRQSVYAVDQTGSMRVAEVRLPTPPEPQPNDHPSTGSAAQTQQSL